MCKHQESNPGGIAESHAVNHCASQLDMRYKKIKEVTVLNAYLISKGHDDIAKVRQALVDILCLLQPLTCGPGVLQPFTASQIYQV